MLGSLGTPPLISSTIIFHVPKPLPVPFLLWFPERPLCLPASHREEGDPELPSGVGPTCTQEQEAVVLEGRRGFLEVTLFLGLGSCPVSGPDSQPAFDALSRAPGWVSQLPARLPALLAPQLGPPGLTLSLQHQEPGPEMGKGGASSGTHSTAFTEPLARGRVSAETAAGGQGRPSRLPPPVVSL